MQYDPATSAGKLVQARGRARVRDSVVAYFGTCRATLRAEVARMQQEAAECTRCIGRMSEATLQALAEADSEVGDCCDSASA